MPSIPESLNQALVYHAAGRLQQAEQIYRQILQQDPQHADAWHLLGVVAHQVGQHAVASDYIGRAIQAAPRVATYHCNLASVYRALSRLDDAIVSYEQALELQPDFPDAHNNLGVTRQDRGQLIQAVACFRRAIALK